MLQTVPLPRRRSLSKNGIYHHSASDIIGDHQQDFPKNEDSYFRALGVLLDTAVDFKNISRLVMGPYAKKATPDQRKLFLEKVSNGAG